MNASSLPSLMKPLHQAVAAARDAYCAANPLSGACFASANRHLPGGNTRTVLHFDPYPLCMDHAAGSRLWDVDGHEYVDFLGEFTAGLFGHSHPVIRDALTAALERGISIGAPGRMEAELARLVCERFRSIELVRFTNSGTEANLLAIAAAIAHTGRRRILVFRRGYHGSVLSFADHAPSLNVPHDWVIGTYNDVAGTSALIDAHGPSLAAVLVEPMLGSGGCVPGSHEFLFMLRRKATESGAVLIFDEVMTSRLSAGGCQALVHVYPDLTVLGKYVGGGMSFGAFGGRRDIMERFDPQRVDALAHAGTFNNNALTMAAGVAALGTVFTASAATELNRRGDELRANLNALSRATGAPLQWVGLGSLMNVHCTRGAIASSGIDEHADRALQELFFFDMLRAGIYMARRGFIALSLCIADDECGRLLRAVENFLVERAALIASVTE